jgi:hypothetical protein
MNLMEQYFAISPFCLLSAISNIFIITTFLRYREINSTYEYQFIFVFSIFILFLDISTLLPSFLFDDTSSAFCIFQGSLIQLSSLSSILWVGFIAYAMLRDIVYIKGRFSKGFKFPLAIILALSTISAIIPIFYSAYKLEGAWCWFETPKPSNEYRNYLFRYILFYGILWAVIILNLVTYVTIWRKVRTESSYDLVGMQTLNRLKWFPWILCFSYLPLTLFRSIQGTHEISLIIAIPCWCIYLLLGFFNGLAYIRSDKVRRFVLKSDIPLRSDTPLSLPIISFI